MEKNNPIISVIIPVYNTEKYLKRCLDSVLNQTFKDFELILVNDGSNDSSLQICKEYESKDSRIKVIDTPNRGSSSARNTGLNESKGDWIIHFDSDDWIELDMLKELYDAGVGKNADIVACGFYLDNGEDNKEARIYPYNDFEPRDKIYRVDMQYSSVCNKLVKKTLYEDHDIHFVDGIRMWDDLVVTMRLRYHSRKTVIVNKPMYHYFCAPRNSICTSDIAGYPYSQIKVVEFLTDYFSKLGVRDREKNKIINSLKVTSKKNIFTLKSEEKFNEWKHLYPEANRFILQMKHIPLKRRIIMYLGAKLSYKQIQTLYKAYKTIFQKGK